MAFNGSGVFNRLYNWANDKAANIKVRADRMDNEMNGFATGLSTCITKDGQTTVTANLPMANFKHTGVADASARTEYASAGQVQDGKLNWVAAGGTADAITATYSPAITTLVDGQICYVRAGAANATTTPTFSPNGLTARTITKNGNQALVAGDIFGASHELILRYRLSDTKWELMNPAYPFTPSTAPFVDSTAIIKGSADATKLLRIEVDGFTTATTRVMTPPNEDFTAVGLATTQTLTNKSLSDSTTFIIDNSDATKKAQFEASSIATGTTRTYTLPDKDGTVAMTSDISSGTLVKISTQTASASATIDFTGLSSTYTKYIIECIDIVPATASSFRARVDTGGGFITTSTYDTYGIGRDSGGNPVSLELSSAAYMDLSAGISLDATSTIGNNFKIEIVLPSHSKRTRIRFISEFKTDGLSRENHACGGGHNTTTSPVTGFRVYMGSGNITSGTFILYGVV